MSDLKPCPFCGTTNELKECRFLDMVGMVYSIECKKCNDTRVMSLVSMEAAKMKWNTRPAEDALKAEIERLKSIIEELTKPRTGGIKAAVQTARKEVLFGTDTNAPDTGKTEENK